MTTDLKITVPDDLRQAMQEVAKAEGKTVAELVRVAMQRYVAQRMLDRLKREGDVRRRGMTAEEVEHTVERAITEHRNEQRLR